MFATWCAQRLLKHSIHCVWEFVPLTTNVVYIDWLAIKFLIQPVLNGLLYYLAVQFLNELKETGSILEIGDWAFKISYSNKIDPPFSRIFKYLIFETSKIFKLLFRGYTLTLTWCIQWVLLLSSQPIFSGYPLPNIGRMFKFSSTIFKLKAHRQVWAFLFDTRIHSGYTAVFSSDIQRVFPSQYWANV